MRLAAAVAIALLAAACGKDEPPPPKAAATPPPKRATETPPAPPVPPAAGRRNDLPDPPPPPPVSVNGVQVGKALGADKKANPDAGPIRANDPVHATVETEGDGQVTLRARFSRIADGKLEVVREEMQEAVTRGPQVYNFQATQPGGWQPGTYQVEVFVNDRASATRRFTVE